MPFISQDEKAATHLRLARNLLWSQAMLLLFGVLFLLVGELYARANNVSISPQGGNTTITVLVLLIAAALTGYVGTSIGQGKDWARWATLVIEAALLGLTIPNNNLAGVILVLLLVGSTLISLFTPELQQLVKGTESNQETPPPPKPVKSSKSR